MPVDEPFPSSTPPPGWSQPAQPAQPAARPVAPPPASESSAPVEPLPAVPAPAETVPAAFDLSTFDPSTFDPATFDASAFGLTPPAPARGGLSWRTRILLFLAPVVLIALLVVLFGGAGISTSTLKLAGFHTQYPSGWTLQTTTGTGTDGGQAFAIGSTSGPVNGLGIGGAGEIALTGESLTVSSPLTPELNAASPQTLIAGLVGTPKDATNLQGGVVEVVQLDGSPAAEESFSYDYLGAPRVQADIAALHGSTVGWLEMDAPASRSSAGQNVFQHAISTWHWN